MNLQRFGFIWLVTVMMAFASATLGRSETSNLPLISYQPDSWQQYAGQSVTLYGTAESETPLTYQWFRESVAIETGERRHSADLNNDHQIDLSELLRVIEIYNHREGTSRTGGYHRAEDTVDGFTPGAED